MAQSHPLNPNDIEHLIGDEPFRLVQTRSMSCCLLGTAHVSKTSAEAVRALIETGWFDAVAVELCPPRHQAIIDQDAWQDLDLFSVLREGKASMLMASLALSAYQRRIAEQFGIEPGAEMKVAIEAAQAQNTPLWLIDREIGITLKRASSQLGWWGRWLMLNGLVLSMFSREEIAEADIEALKQGDMLDQTFAQFSEQSPALYDSLIAERDRFMAARLKQEEAHYPHSPAPQNVLCVIGAGHLAGTAEALGRDEDFDQTLAELNQTPQPSHVWKAIPWVIVAAVLGGFGLGFSRSPELGFALIATWVVINGGLSGLGALLAKAHPVTVLTAVLAAPLTSLNPTVGAGMVTGAVEAWLKKPRIGDFDRLRDDVGSLSGWYRNRIAHVLLVFFLSNLGSAIGTWVAGLSMIRQLSAGS